MGSFHKIFSDIDSEVIAESLQELVEDLRSTQRGDRTNPVYLALRGSLISRMSEIDLAVDRLCKQKLVISENQELYIAAAQLDLQQLTSSCNAMTVESVLRQYRI